MTEKKEQKKPLTEAELQAFREAKKKAREEDRKKAEVLQTKLPDMSYNQLRGELKRASKKEGLDGAFGAILLTILDTTKTPENSSGKLWPYPR